MKFNGLSLFKRWCIGCVWFALLWMLLNQNDAASWVLGVFFVCAASALSIGLSTHRKSEQTSSIRFIGCVTFIPYFIWQSLRGGWDVATYALYPNKPVNGGFYRYKTTLTEGLPGLVLIQVVSLLPGTMSTSASRDHIVIHILDIDTFVVSELSECERRVSSLFNFKTPDDKRALT